MDTLPPVLNAADVLLWDFDGTLGRLDVDWDAVRADLGELAADLSPEGPWVGALVAALAEAGRRHEALAVLRAHEARASLTAVPASIAFLHDHGARWRHAVVSDNLHATLVAGLAHLGVAERFEALVGRDVVPAGKPHPAGILAACGALGVSVSRAVLVGDSDKDRDAAATAGVAFVHVDALPDGAAAQD